MGLNSSSNHQQTPPAGAITLIFDPEDGKMLFYLLST
jgi:hypothetical protein